MHFPCLFNLALASYVFTLRSPARQPKVTEWGDKCGVITASVCATVANKNADTQNQDAKATLGCEQTLLWERTTAAAAAAATKRHLQIGFLA